MTRDNPYRDEQNNRTIQVWQRDVVYRDHIIREKRDFGDYGFRRDGFLIKHGYVVIKDHCNVMPGACWFLTVDAAMRAIDDLIDSQRGFVITSGEHPFWVLNRFRRNAEERAPELALLLQELVDAGDAYVSGPHANAARFVKARLAAQAVLDQIDWNCDMRPITIRYDSDGKPSAPPVKQGERTFGRFGGVLPLQEG